jgi:hypothetical protein
MAEVVSLEQQGLSGGFREGVREAVPEVQPGPVPALPEVSVRFPGDASLIESHRLDPQFRGFDQFIETTAGDRIAARVDDYRGLYEVRGRDPPDLRFFDRKRHVAGVILGPEDRDKR